MDFDKAGNSKDLNNEKLQLICKAYNRELLSNQRVVDGINSMDYSKLKILCKYNNKLSCEDIEELLSNKEAVDNINNYDDEMFRSILNDTPSGRNILEILKGGEVCNTNNEFESSDSEEDVDFSDYNSDSEENEDHYNLNYEEMETSSENQNAAVSIPSAEVDNKKSEDQNDCEEMEISSENQNAAMSIPSAEVDNEKSEDQNDCEKMEISSENQNAVMNTTEDQNDCNDKLQLLFDRFPPKEITELLENQKAVDNVTHYTIEGLQLMFDSYDLSPQNIIKVLEHITFGKFKILCERFNFEDTKTLLENHIIVERLESIDYEKLKLICDKFGSNVHTLLGNHIVVEHLESIDYEKLKLICDKFGSNVHTLLGNHIVVEHLESIDYEKLKLICDKFDSSAHTLLGNQRAVDNIINHTIEKLEELFYHSELTLQNIIKVLEDITFGKSKILLSSFGFRSIHQLLKDQMVAKVIDDIAPEKLELICNRLSSNAHTLLENQKVVNNITNYTIEELLLVLYTCDLSDKNIIKILEHITSEKFKILCERFDFRDTKTLLENQKVVNNITNYTIEELHSMFNAYDLSNQIITTKGLLLALHNTYGLSDQNIKKVLEHFTLEKLQLIYEKFDVSNAKTLLENQKAVGHITRYTIKELYSMFDPYDLSPQNIIKVLENITFEKFKILYERFNFEDTKTLLENHIIVERLESIDYKKLKFICDKFDSNAHTLLGNHIVVEHLESIDYEKLELICNKFNFEDTKALLENQKAVDNITRYTIKELYSMFDRYDLSPQNIITVLENITFGKFKILCERFNFEDTKTLLENENAVKYIGSVNDQKLEEIIDTIHSVDLVNIFKNFTPGVKSTLRFVIPLFRAGQVRDINIDYLNNKERIYEDIIKYVPQDLRIYTQYPFPGIGIDVKDLPQGLDIDIEPFIPLPTFKRCTEYKEPVSKLYNLSLEQVIENINPNKRARYS